MARDDRLRVQVLGPIRALDAEGHDRTPDGVLQRRLLALLVLRRGHVVSVDAAVDVLWPVDPPLDPAAALQNHISRLRRRLPDGAVGSVGDGYRLEPARVALDADRLAAMVDAGRLDEGLDADLGSVLDAWDGPAYPELDDVDAGRTEAVRLEDLRVRARELLAERRLTAGDTVGLVAELAALVDAEPLRERPRALLMEALVAEGRQVDAQRAYDEFRRQLADELGNEPTPVLAARHAQLLQGVGGSGAARPTRLPVPASSLIGREELIEEVVALAGSSRLVTLVGPGGVGKTRMLLEVGRRLALVGPPVVLAELASVDARSAVEAVAVALGIDTRAGIDPTARITGVLGDQELVLLLDNCEHVVDTVAAMVDEVLLRCPGVRVVATTRERLRVGGEQVSVVPALPDDGPFSAAVELFVERARSVVPRFEPDDTDRDRILELVARLDGLPLAIELAAARLHTLELEEVLAGLDRRFAVLEGGNRANARHASLGAAVAWSYGLLDRALQDAFVDLSVFVDPFEASAAAAVCGTDERTVTEILSQLVERSLVVRVPSRRYGLLETLRAFGAERLGESGRLALVGARHAHHQVEWVERAQDRLAVPGRPVLAEIDRALPELRAALGWLMDHDEVEQAGSLVAALLDYGVLRLRPDVMAWAEEVLALDAHRVGPHAPRLWVVAAYAAWLTGDMVESERRTAMALEAGQAGSGSVPPEVLSIRGNQALFEGELSEAAAWYGRAVEASRGQSARRIFVAATELLPLGYAGDPSVGGKARALLDEVGEVETPYAAYAWYCAGEAVLTSDLELARTRLAMAIELAEATHTSFVTGVAGASKVSIDARLGDPADAATAYRRLIEHWRRAGVWST
ncbi:MAG TPA: BTAD domain-containing putative transcriptional regulator, partial [Acidimicrobiales bacterium]